MSSDKTPQPFLFEGGKRAILLLHAYTGSANDMRLLGRAIEKEGYTVYGPNLSGHATMRFEDIVDASPEAWMKDVQEATAFLQSKGYKEIAIFGLSLGGILATRALEIGTYIGGGSFNSPIFQIGESEVPNAFMNYYTFFQKNQGISNTEIEDNRERVQAKMEEQLEEIESFSEIIQDEIESITTPYYIACAGADELIDPKNGFYLKEALTNATVSFHYFEEATHVITVGPKRKPFEETVIQFISQLPWKEGEL